MPARPDSASTDDGDSGGESAQLRNSANNRGQSMRMDEMPQLLKQHRTLSGDSIRSVDSVQQLINNRMSKMSLIKYPTNHGPEIIFAEPLQRQYECPVCCQVLRYPVQFEECGHRCCSSCLPELLRVAPRCPIDQIKVDRSKVYVDKAFQTEIDNIRVRCSNVNGGCKWTGKLRELKVHYDDCKYTIIQCPKNCGAEFEKRFSAKHLQDDCPKRGVICDFCKNEISYEEEIDHLNTCGKFPVPCPNGCKEKEIPREMVEEHLAKACPKQKTECYLSRCGCKYKGERKAIEKHIKEEPGEHLIMLAEFVMRTNERMDEHDLKLESFAKQMKTAENTIDALDKLYGSQLVWKIDDYKNKLHESQNGSKPTIFSPPFLTSRHGYKMAMSACLNGDGKSRGRHMSLFICICKGDYDPLLVWPFCHRVTFTLIDQCQDPAARRNVTYTLKPNTCKENKPFVGRPTGERNASFGAQKFVELEVMNTLDYIRDDTIYIKVDISSEDMPKL